MSKSIYQDNLNEFDNKLKEYAINLVKSEMEKLKPDHKANFDRMFGSIDKEPIEQLRQFYRICKMTIAKYELPIPIAEHQGASGNRLPSDDERLTEYYEQQVRNRRYDEAPDVYDE
jgi:hypothetical protein